MCLCHGNKQAFIISFSTGVLKIRWTGLLLWKCIATPMASAFYNACFRCLITLHEHKLLHSPITRRGIECYYSIQSLSQNFPTRHQNRMLQVRFNLLTYEHWQVLTKSSIHVNVQIKVLPRNYILEATPAHILDIHSHMECRQLAG